MSKIAIGSDHVGYELKPIIIEYLKELGHEVTDFGAYSSERTDYPIYGKKVAEEVANHNYDLGILICGTGVGISLSANKVPGIRAVVCSEPYSAKLSKQHNNTNILAFGSRVIGSELAKMIVKEWLDAKFIGGRHQRRIDEMAAIEEKNDKKFESIRVSNNQKYLDK
ncbi:ribose-5-phosphate isomerase [Loigolactobacillus coryniformis subsp. coryniformis]|uniref:Ribose-5-phosphate isomerase B n=1 Tax=Loigolactobacillus coryniformis subsp. coryniformis KCTC 3167 = DSM 20001 TaxID=913848 RepID=A0A0R1F9G2_9LACO|nr:ribose 5-phosphate isomerase B [Loigolactobacillus coryniformis]ATO56170.1 ribose 5-phosphate isomerase B [Loigolactobacillus coryniformis subsp. coryniformis KCTC 3167 = DSM 20001]KRK18344.1 ribose-5-phosphate isomerase B [Loigolactobacillus coryniformis subsp. coryniformis KCTC 3167 = DSM 20001]OEH89252.1 ribose-5-phosphate isomerase [Loigolactobacillus coryniformis subsp. coryniformis]